MNRGTAIKIFEQKQTRIYWGGERGKWYFSVVDVFAIFKSSPNAIKYWSALKTRLKKEGDKPLTNCNPRKTQSVWGKPYSADMQQLFRFQYYQPNNTSIINAARVPVYQPQ